MYNIYIYINKYIYIYIQIAIDSIFIWNCPVFSHGFPLFKSLGPAPFKRPEARMLLRKEAMARLQREAQEPGLEGAACRELAYACCICYIVT